MGSAIEMRMDYSVAELRRQGKSSRDCKQSRRLLSLAVVLDGMSREDAARVGGMDRQTLRDWVHRFNDAGPCGLKDAWNGGPEPRLSAVQKAELARIVETGPDNAVNGVVRWRRVDLQKLIKERFGVDYRHCAAMGKAGHAAPSAGRPALQKRLSVRRHLPGTWHRSRAGATLLRHRGHATSSRRDQPPCRQARSQTLTRIAQRWPVAEIEMLMPWNFKPDAIS